MSDSAISQLVEQEIRRTVQQQVQQAVSQVDWIADLENQIIESIQPRIIGKFNNINSAPQLAEAVKQGIRDLFSQGQIPGIKEFIDPVSLENAISQSVNDVISKTIDNLALDQAWLTRVQAQINQRMAERVLAAISGMDVKLALKEILLDNVQDVLRVIQDGFETAGIKDSSNSLQLTVMDDVVVVENELAAKNLKVVKDAEVVGDLTINGNLSLRGGVNTDNIAWQELANTISERTLAQVQSNFTQEVVNHALSEVSKGVNINNIKVDGEYLISEGTLAPSITKSSLTEIGSLTKLDVDGQLSVARNRVGINTNTPDSALTIWDEEVSLSAGKLSDNIGFIGTSRKQALVIGVNRQNHLQVDTEGLVTVQKLQVGRNKIGHGFTTPNYAGTKGDVVFNTNITPGGAFAWMCLGNFNWLELRSA